MKHALIGILILLAYVIWETITDESGNRINGVNVTIINNGTRDTLYNRLS